MTLATKNRIDVSFVKEPKSDTGTMILYRNHVKEVTIKGASDYLNDAITLLVQQRDYDQFSRHYGMEDCPIGSWLYNVIAIERDLAYEFQKVVVIPEGKQNG